MANRKSKSGRVLPKGVTERKDGRFLYRYSLYGKTCYLYDTDLNELKKKIVELNYNILKGERVDMSKLTLGEWYPQFIQIYKVGKIKDSTLQNYIEYYDWYIKGSLIDRMPLKELKRVHLIAHFDDLAQKRNLAYTTLKSLASMIYNAIQQAAYDGVININPAKDIMKEIQARPKKVKDALTVEQVRVLIDFLKREGEWQHVHLPVIAIGLSLGCRCGELYGLTWKDVDFENEVVKINHTIHYRKSKGEREHKFFITSPKTAKSNREIPMTSEVKKLFEMQKQYQKDMRIRQDISIDGYKGFVFTTKLGTPYTHEAVTRTLDCVVKRANEWEAKRALEENREPVVIPRHTPHVWRYTLTTRLVESDVNLVTAKNILGHARLNTTIDIYNRISKKQEEKMKADLEGVISVL